MQRLDMLKMPFHLLVELSVLQRHGGLICERLQEGYVAIGIDPPCLIRHREHTNKFFACVKRCSDHCAVTRAALIFTHLITDLNLAIVQNVRRPNWSSLSKSPARNAHTRRDRATNNSLGKDVTSRRQTLRRSIRLNETKRCSLSAKQIPDTGHHSLSNCSTVECLGKRLRNSGEFFCFAPASLGFFIKASIVNAY